MALLSLGGWARLWMLRRIGQWPRVVRAVVGLPAYLSREGNGHGSSGTVRLPHWGNPVKPRKSEGHLLVRGLSLDQSQGGLVLPWQQSILSFASLVRFLLRHLRRSRWQFHP